MKVRRLVPLALVGVLLGLVVAIVVNAAPGLEALGLFRPARTTPVYDPPVLAGQHLWGACSGGFYARTVDTIVLTSTGHCASEGTVAYEPDGTTVRGVFGPAARDASCDVAGKTCAASDINYLVVAENRIPWGRLNMIDLGTGGYRTLDERTRPLRCEDIRIGDTAEINGRDIHRAGEVAEKGESNAGDSMSFPCMIAAHIPVATGDSGGAVLVNGQPAGVTSRSYGGLLGFTPLSEGLEQLGLVLCTTPDCGLIPPGPG